MFEPSASQLWDFGGVTAQKTWPSSTASLRISIFMIVISSAPLQLSLR